ncbi:uncharacterized protein MELLADRAFT_73106 [Melampsora larici-populina 98AG31]|uniref:Uncharacterized protein n=1 Tax=Melampsora larici-populina (strain 98AG31 / pathotype 3-4-7) TaxID=747676 RepID=F4S379_MELLP|nr:uncharacterized protein MELLADRAFT_73106 [Melampsora larici-populina 98AG31]EGG00935.1 hypothetical protein MELLADRAFT_73106 [Melampsora larici-populina 98AG31]
MVDLEVRSLPNDESKSGTVGSTILDAKSGIGFERAEGERDRQKKSKRIALCFVRLEEMFLKFLRQISIFNR